MAGPNTAAAKARDITEVFAAVAEMFDGLVAVVKEDGGGVPALREAVIDVRRSLSRVVTAMDQLTAVFAGQQVD